MSSSTWRHLCPPTRLATGGHRRSSNHPSYMYNLALLMGLAHQAIEYRLLDPDFILNQQEEDEDEQDDEAEEQDAPRPIRPFPLDHSFDVRAYSDTYSIQEFRFTCAQLQEIIGLLRIPPFIVTPSRDKVDSLTVLCMAMYRLSFPERLNRMERMFRRSAPSISRLINQIVRWVMLRWDRLLYWDEHRLTREKLSEYADACYHASGGQCNNVFAFVDGTAREIQMPTINQQAMYSGHKCHHCVKYQGIVAPDGILLHLSSAFSGTNHDMTIFDGTGFQQVLDQFAYDQNGVALAIYGDSAYTANGHVLIGYRGNGLTPDQIAFNRVMSSLRVTIEWTFKHITQQFMGIDFPRTHRLLSTWIEGHYRFAALFSNIHTCYNGGEVNTYFNINPPTVQEYISAAAMRNVLF